VPSRPELDARLAALIAEIQAAVRRQDYAAARRGVRAALVVLEKLRE